PEVATHDSIRVGVEGRVAHVEPVLQHGERPTLELATARVRLAASLLDLLERCRGASPGLGRRAEGQRVFRGARWQTLGDGAAGQGGGREEQAAVRCVPGHRTAREAFEAAWEFSRELVARLDEMQAPLR